MELKHKEQRSRCRVVAMAYEAAINEVDIRYRKVVEITDAHGSTLVYFGAFCMTWSDNTKAPVDDFAIDRFLVVFSLIHGVSVFSLEEIEDYATYIRMPEKVPELIDVGEDD